MATRSRKSKSSLCRLSQKRCRVAISVLAFFWGVSTKGSCSASWGQGVLLGRESQQTSSWRSCC